MHIEVNQFLIWFEVTDCSEHRVSDSSTTIHIKILVTIVPLQVVCTAVDRVVILSIMTWKMGGRGWRWSYSSTPHILNGSEMIKIIPQLIHPRGTNSYCSLMRWFGKVGTRAGLGLVVVRTIFSPCWESNSDHQPAAWSLYNWPTHNSSWYYYSEMCSSQEGGGKDGGHY
jgi:hypothetical protein